MRKNRNLYGSREQEKYWRRLFCVCAGKNLRWGELAPPIQFAFFTFAKSIHSIGSSMPMKNRDFITRIALSGLNLVSTAVVDI